MRLTVYNALFTGTVAILVIIVAREVMYEREVKKPIELYKVPFHIPRKAKQQEEVRNNVPLVIYESWGSHEVPKGMRDNIYALLEANPEFDYYLYSDEDCAAFIEDNFDKDVLDAFQSLKPGAFKSDLWRYCILYKMGGVYLDIKYYSLVPLIDIIDENQTVYVNDTGASILKTVRGDFSNGYCIYNGFLISPPKNEIFKKCIDDIVHSSQNRLYKRNDLDVTGPCLLGSVVEAQYSSDYIKDSKFSYVHGFLGMDHNISYKGKAILKHYESYRLEQVKSQKTKHYGVLYAKRDIYA